MITTAQNIIRYTIFVQMYHLCRQSKRLDNKKGSKILQKFSPLPIAKTK